MTSPPALSATAATPSCDRPDAVTRSLLGYGVLAGPMYVAVSLTQALTRRGFSLGQDEWSLLADGSLGWIQVTNLILTGAMLVSASAVRCATGPAAGGCPGCSASTAPG